MSITPKQICVDWDGTCCYHQYPNMGGPVPGAVRVLQRLKKSGHTLIMLTMRDGDLLNVAKDVAKVWGIEFDYYNCNPMMETGSRKVYAHLYIDDHGAFMPLIQPPAFNYKHRKPYVDWITLETWLEQNGYLPK